MVKSKLGTIATEAVRLAGNEGLFMPRSLRWMSIFLGLAFLTPVSPAQTASPTPTVPAAAPKHYHKRHKAPPKQAVLPPLRPGPLPQLPLDLMPAAPPKVSFQGGLLTIVAQNSTLGDILRDVHQLTGASIDVPPNATERVVTKLGPGAPRDVLASLLNGTGFNYVMLGSSSDPTGVASVILTTRPAGSNQSNQTTQTATNTLQPSQQPGFPPRTPMSQPLVAQQHVVAQPAATDGDDPNADDQDAADENADQDQTDSQQPDANGAQQEPQQSPQPNAGPKTPEQILEMLRRQQPTPPGLPGAQPQQPPQN